MNLLSYHISLAPRNVAVRLFAEKPRRYKSIIDFVLSWLPQPMVREQLFIGMSRFVPASTRLSRIQIPAWSCWRDAIENKAAFHVLCYNANTLSSIITRFHHSIAPILRHYDGANLIRAGEKISLGDRKTSPTARRHCSSRLVKNNYCTRATWRALIFKATPSPRVT